jgi:opacity protein-like surface antigen
MKRLVLNLLLFFIISSICLAQGNKQFYAGVTGGLVMMRNLHENWNNIAHTQSADLVYDMNNGFLVGAKFGYMPKALRKILVTEIEYTFQKATIGKATSAGFIAGTDTIHGFSTNKLNNSGTYSHSVFLNFMVRYPAGNCHPYIGFGPGLSFTSVFFHEEPYFGESGSDADFSWQVLAGVDFDITYYLSLGGGYKYFSVRPTVTWANGTHSHYDPASNNFFIDVKFHF